MGMRIILTSVILVLCASSAQAQFWKKKKSKETESARPTAMNPLPRPDQYQGKASKKNNQGTTYNAERNFYERKEQLAKERRKNERLLQKPQYSDPSYFGHKRPPKKRKPGKMKFCKECGIRH